jgi:hypothetical protein
MRALVLILLVMALEAVAAEHTAFATRLDGGPTVSAAHQDFGPGEDEDLASEFDPRMVVIVSAFTAPPVLALTSRAASPVEPRTYGPELAVFRGRAPPVAPRCIPS